MAIKSTEIRWPLSTSPGARPQESAGRLINCYAEPIGEKLGAVYHRIPGCTAFGAETGTDDWTYWSPFEPWFNVAQAAISLEGLYRGGIFVDGTLFVCTGTSVYAVSASGVATHLGDVDGSDKVFFARNNAQPIPDVVLVAEAGVFVVTTSNVAAYPDPDVGSPNCCVGHDGFIIFGYGNGDMISTDINTTNINTNNLARAESNPDGINQLVSYSGYLYAFGTATYETWGYPLNDLGFPLNRIGYNNTPGLIGPHCIAGFEPEWGQAPIYIGSDHTVRWMKGGEPQEISTPQLQRLITAVPENNFEVLVYVANGVPFWEISGPTFTWVFNCASARWHEHISYLLMRSRYNGSVFAFDNWMCGDTQVNGRMLEIDGTVYAELENPLVPEMESLPVEDFPAFVSIPRADFEFTSGVGIVTGHDPDQTNPFAEVSWSNDGGVTWSVPWFRELGRQQKSLRRITVRRTGMSGPQGRRWRIAMPSKVHFGFVGANCDAYLTDK